MNFSERLLHWYQNNHRKLPWRDTQNPYFIWLSEIILQQTRVDQGLQYYLNFTEAYPTVQALAAAAEDDVLKLWQGLGYYSRARNLHFTAKHITTHLNGKFPDNAAALQQLKGVGPYTAAAIASFAFGEVVPVVDGNVARVLSRYFGMELPIDSTAGKKMLDELAKVNISAADPATYNQAIMEFGALQCVPKSPNCSQCLFNSSCFALQHQKVDQLPLKAKKTKTTDRWFDYFIFHFEGDTWLHKRTQKGIWHNLYDFPHIEHQQSTDLSTLMAHPQLAAWAGTAPLHIIRSSATYKHVLSHQRLHVRFIEIQLQHPMQQADAFLRIPRNSLQNYPVPRLVDKYLKESTNAPQTKLF